MKIVVVEPERMAASVRERLDDLGSVTYGPFDGESLSDAVADCDVIMVRLGHFIGSAVFDAAPSLRYIVTATTGLDHIDLDEARRRAIRVISLRDCPDRIRDVSATAELTWGLLLALVRHISSAAEHVRDGGWSRNLFWGTQLRGKRLGIIGYGRIGAMVADYGLAFGMDVVAHDRHPKKISPPVRACSLSDLLHTVDVVSVHITAEPANLHLIGSSQISVMKRGSVLINTARGMVIDSAAVAHAIERGHLAGAAVDVLEHEEHAGHRDDPLLAAGRAGHPVIITPHIGGAALEAIAQAERAVLEILCGVCEVAHART